MSGADPLREIGGLVEDGPVLENRQTGGDIDVTRFPAPVWHAQAGGIRGESVKLVPAPLTGLPVPATSELVIEGEIPPDETHAEGPFGEWAGYYAGAYANRFVVVVDDDIDPTDTNEVLWAMCTRTDVIDDIDVMKRCWSTSLDPMAYAGEEGLRYYNNRMIIDACRPYDRLATFPEVVRTSDEDAARLRARWPELFNAAGRATRGRGGPPAHR